MLGQLHRALLHLALAATCALVVIAPEHLYHLAYGGYQTRLNLATFGILTVLFTLALSGSTATFLSLAGLAVFLQFVQLLHFSYFGSLISPHAVILLFSEAGEIFESLGGVIGHMLLPVLIATLETTLLLVLYRTTRRFQVKIPYAWAPLASVLLILPIRASKPNATAQDYYPNPREYGVANTLFAVSYFLGRDLPLRLKGYGAVPVHCRPYQRIRTGEPLADNIVIVMGESLNPAHMSLFGYARDTTPRLRALARTGELTATVAYSAGILTKVTLPMFYNIQREPGNFDHMARMESNLFRMAKEQGFITHYVSAQKANLATFVGERYLDVFRTKEDMEEAVADRKDRVLVDYLKNVDWAKRNFIVLHQRNSHGPYDQHYPPEFARFPSDALSDLGTFLVNTYDNAILFTDTVVAEIIGYVKTHSGKRTLLVFTADHAELMGETGKFGHGHLQLETARVPFLTYGRKLAPGTRERLSGLREPTHYEIGQQLGAVLGYRVTNPNETPGVYYVNGQDIGGRSGYLVLDKRPSPPQVTSVNTIATTATVCAGGTAVTGRTD